ncbi:MAG TPA: hypothetical protein PLO62_12410 [Candidatus Hydrogenedentes bacterium]|nr:hypothetical protein [Candidatus Hydrogenedentota bacterium]HOS03909.1 hypothetical protein [Candidatus Hydrogenedentota bacterium]
MKQPHFIQREEGVALLTATIFIAIAVIVLGALSTRAITQNNQVAQYVTHGNCLQGVEAGIAQSLASIEAGGSGNIGLGAWTPSVSQGAIVLPHFDSHGIAPVALAAMPRITYFAFAQNWISDGLDNNGDGAIDNGVENGVFTIYASARNAGVTRRVETVYTRVDVNVWRNAIFAGAGQSGGLINGNVSIHGSVHLLGNNILAGGAAIEAIDLSGTSLIHNNYVGIPADLQARIPPLPTTVFGGETVQTIEAKLRVRRGLVGMSGNSEIGQSNVTGNAIKETMDGAYVNDGWSGTSVVSDGGRGDPRNVFSDNGWDAVYDLGDRVPFPTLDSNWRDPLTGLTAINPGTGALYTHDQYFQTLASTPYNGNITITANANFYYNATRPADPNPANIQPGDDYIYYNGTTKQLRVNGQIQVNGSLTINRGGGNDKTIHYTGRAALLVKGDVTLNTDLLSVNANGTTANSFPVNNILGIMAQNNMYVGSVSQLSLMGAFYAQGMIRSTKQTIVTGTFVSNYFDMGTNVPEIYQVPALADNLPLGMIGAYPIWVLTKVSWRELGA